MAKENFTQATVRKQIAQNSGQVAIGARDGGYQFIDQMTGRTLSGPPVDSSLLAIPQSVNDPRLTNQALNLARGFYQDKNVPDELVEAIASVAAYTSVTQGIPVTSLISSNGLSNEMIRAYNSFKPKSTQLGYFSARDLPSWTNNPTLRGSIRAALVDV